MEPKPKKKSKRNLLYHLALLVLPVIYGIFTQLRFRRSAEIPKGKFIVCCNHITGHDPFYLALFHRRRKVCFMAKEELFKNKLLAARSLKTETCSVFLSRERARKPASC